VFELAALNAQGGFTGPLTVLDALGVFNLEVTPPEDALGDPKRYLMVADLHEDWNKALTCPIFAPSRDKHRPPAFSLPGLMASGESAYYTRATPMLPTWARRLVPWDWRRGYSTMNSVRHTPPPIGTWHRIVEFSSTLQVFLSDSVMRAHVKAISAEQRAFSGAALTNIVQRDPKRQRYGMMGLYSYSTWCHDMQLDVFARDPMYAETVPLALQCRECEQIIPFSDNPPNEPCPLRPGSCDWRWTLR
jgi:hypothetical protein